MRQTMFEFPINYPVFHLSLKNYLFHRLHASQIFFGRHLVLGQSMSSHACLFMFFVDKRAADDPDFKVAERFSTMPRDEVYDQAVRIYTSFAPKAKAYGYDQIDSDVYNFYLE